MNRKGFTLLEVLIVVIIIGILAAISMPQYMKTIERAKTAEAMSNLGALRGSMDRYWYEEVAMGGEYVPATFAMNFVDVIPLDIDNPNAAGRREWAYGLTDGSSINNKIYVIEARRIEDDGVSQTTWIRIDQDGEITKSPNLGGREEQEDPPPVI